MSSRERPRIVPPVTVARETQWLKGGIIGAVAASLLGLLTVASLDGLSDSGANGGDYLRGAGYGAAFGFTLGALIGGQFEKR
jgi:hypothetical protein